MSEYQSKTFKLLNLFLQLMLYTHINYQFYYCQLLVLSCGDMIYEI